MEAAFLQVTTFECLFFYARRIISIVIVICVFIPLQAAAALLMEGDVTSRAAAALGIAAT